MTVLHGACDRIFTSWNTTMFILFRNVWNVPNTTHKYFIEEISETRHIKTKLFQIRIPELY